MGWGKRAFVFHEAADTAIFRPPEKALSERSGIAWVGNWGDGERSAELENYLLSPARTAGLSLDMYGVRYPMEGRATLERYGAHYRGWVANTLVPDVFSRYRMTVHVPRCFYRTHLPGIPTIRVFEALACGIPLICAPWSDREGLFRPGEHYQMAHSKDQMVSAMRAVASDDDLAQNMSETGLKQIAARHTCRHRAEELLAIAAALKPSIVEAAQ
jgi:spore maturation protein CgeB